MVRCVKFYFIILRMVDLPLPILPSIEIKMSDIDYDECNYFFFLWRVVIVIINNLKYY
jgi:hypothetical protein